MNVSLRPMVLSDWGFYRSLYMNQETMEFIAQPLNEAECKKYFHYYFSKKYKTSKNKLFMIVVTNDSKEEIKAGIIQYIFKPKCTHTAEMGIMLSSGLTGHGVGKQANLVFFKKVSVLVKLKRIYARINIHNLAAQKLYVKLGFRQVINSKRDVKRHDLWLADTSVFGV